MGLHPRAGRHLISSDILKDIQRACSLISLLNFENKYHSCAFTSFWRCQKVVSIRGLCYLTEVILSGTTTCSLDQGIILELRDV